jgi:hypothetical protein
MNFRRPASLLLMAGALAATALLWAADARQGWRDVSGHARVGASALILIGAAYIVLQAERGAAGIEIAKGVLLGGAFVLWGAEQFLPAGPLATGIDGVVIAIFVVDLSLVIWGRVRPGR